MVNSVPAVVVGGSVPLLAVDSGQQPNSDKALHTFGNIVKYKYSHLAYPIMC